MANELNSTLYWSIVQVETACLQVVSVALLAYFIYRMRPYVCAENVTQRQ